MTPWACAVALLAGCYSPYVLPSVGFDQTAALPPPKDVEVAVGTGYQLGTSAAPDASRAGFAYPQGSALATFALPHSMAVVASAGNGAGEAGLKIHLPVQAFDLAVQPEAGFSSSWTLQGSNGFLGSGTLSGGADLAGLARHHRHDGALRRPAGVGNDLDGGLLHGWPRRGRGVELGAGVAPTRAGLRAELRLRRLDAVHLLSARHRGGAAVKRADLLAPALVCGLAACAGSPLPLQHAFGETAFQPDRGTVEVAGTVGSLEYGNPIGQWVLGFSPDVQGQIRIGLTDHLALRLVGSEAGVGPGLEIAVQTPRPWTPWQWNLQLTPEVSALAAWLNGSNPYLIAAPSADAIFSVRPTERSALSLAARFTRTFASNGVQSATTVGLGYAIRLGKVELRPELTFSYLQGSDVGNFVFYELFPSITLAGVAGKREPSKPEEPKIEPPKPEEQIPVEPKPEEEKAEEPKPEAAKPAEVKPEEPKPEPEKPAEVKPEEPKPEPAKPAEVKPEEPKPEPAKPAEVKPEEPKPEPRKPAEVKPEEPKPEPAKPAEVKPEEPKPEPATSEPAKSGPPKPDAERDDKVL